MNFVCAILYTLSTLAYGFLAYLAAVESNVALFCFWTLGACIWSGLSGWAWTDAFLKR